MALATKCPQCGAMFRVVADQLKLRGGLEWALTRCCAHKVGVYTFAPRASKKAR